MADKERPLLLLMFSVLGDIVQGKMNPPTRQEFEYIPVSINTPLGFLRYQGIYGLEFVSIPTIDKAGVVKRVQVRRLYLENILESIAVQLQIDVMELIISLMQYRRIVIVAAITAGEPMLFYSQVNRETNSQYPPKSMECEYCPCYMQTQVDQEQILNMKGLESTVGYCLENNLSTLPPLVCDEWKDSFLQPLMERIVSAMENDSKHAG